MKRLTILVLSLFCVLGLIGCADKQDETVTFSFSGEHEYFVITDGWIVLNDTEEVFDGGNLEVVQSGLFEDVVSFSATFYTIRNEEKHIILSNSVVDQTGGAVHFNGDLGSITGDDIINREVAGIDNLWFELKTMDLSGNENTYQIRLTLTA